jgi:hypothetical protein
MPTRPRDARRARADDHRTFFEEIALMLSFVVVVVSGMTLVTLVVMEFMQVLPIGLSFIFGVSLTVFGIAIGMAVMERALALPSMYRGLTPVVRYHT